MEHSQKLWTKGYIFMLLSNLFIYLGFYMLTPTLPAYAKLSGGSSLESSLVVSTFSITSLLIRLFTGNIMDKIEIKPLLLIGTIILAASTLSYIWLPLDAIILMRVVQGIGWGLASTGAAAIFSSIIPEKRRGEGMGYYSLSMIISMALSPVVAIVIMNLYSFKNIAIISIALVIVGAIFLQGVNLNKKLTNTPNSKKKINLKDAFEQKAALPSLLCFLLTVTLCGIMSYIMLYGKELKISSIWIYFVGYVAMVLLTRPAVGKIFDKKGHVVVILPGAICMIIGLIILSYAASVPILLLSSLFYGVGYGAVQPSLQAWAVNRSPSNRKGAANGTFLSSMDLAYTFGSILLSFVAEKKSYGFMYRFSAIFIILLILIYSYNIFKSKYSNESLEEKVS
ncbi:Predicted arabinose efflux permease, MFS family [Clostridium acidisoli DSM 12555]|uniref:Predicted arabinose efflux permease, MFS family n=2 Tax=Clostridium TaxID=1485 RepID=A0A1W1XKR2_9CLOT|nr:MFS transporter [Clostridium acidisoli]SMC24563.1 Predicted arabinose efflux permease, MFS family [Clostridium acidisoli DSM 12555]